MAREQSASPLDRRDWVLEQLDAGHRALLESLEGLDPEEAFVGSRWSVWEVVKHLDSAGFVDSLEQLAAGHLERLPPFPRREERLRQDLEHLEGTFGRLRSLVAHLSQEQLSRPATSPAPHNAFPALTLLELLERVAGHEATHARQVEATRRYVAAFAARQRAVAVVGLGPGEPAFVTPRVRELVSNADYVAGAGPALEVVRPWVRGVEVTMGQDNAAEVVCRLGQEARAGAWSVLCCLGDPAESSPELIALARQQCDGVVVHPGIGYYQLALAACHLASGHALAFATAAISQSPAAAAELEAALRTNGRHLVLLGGNGTGEWSALARGLLAAGIPGPRRLVALAGLTLGGGRRQESTLEALGRDGWPWGPGTALVFAPEPADPGAPLGQGPV